MTDAFPQELPDAEVTSIAIEYGTYTVPEVLGAVRADNWLHQRGDLKSALGRALKADMKERFFPAGDKWREMVWARADQTIGWTLKGLDQKPPEGKNRVNDTPPNTDAARLRLRQALQRAPLFADLDTDSMAAIERELTLLVLPGGAPLFRQGEPADAVYVVASGCLGVFRHDDDDEEPGLIAEITPGNIVGEMSLLSHSQRTRSVAALRDSEVWRLAQRDFEALAARHPGGAAGA